MALAGAGNLKIGDVVLLYYNADQRFATDSGEKSGFILADLSGSNTQQLLTVRPSETSGRGLPNLQFGTFKVLVSNKYEAQTRYRALMEKMKEYKRKKADQSSIQLLQLQLTQSKSDCAMEQAENAAKQRRLQGSSVFYGESIQLQHTLTGKYVCVSTTDTSVTENTKLLVFLQRKDSLGCIFRLHPRIKVQTVGEEVNYDDQIKFESVATEGQYLHCSKKTFGDIKINALSECYELNLAAKDSPIRIICHYHPPTLTGSRTDNTLKANGTVRFYHRKHQCYIVGEGSFIGRYGDLPEVSGWNSMAETIESANFGRRRSNYTQVVPSDQKTFEVRADMGSISEDVASTVSSLQLPFDLDSQEQIAPDKSLTQSAAGLQSKRQSYLTKRGVKRPSTSGDDVVSEDVHFRRRNRTLNLPGQTYTSPIALWQIEKFNQPCSGGAMQWSEQCRIKHLLTRRYLAVTGVDPHYKVTLKSSSSDTRATVFELFPVIQQVGGEIDYESYVRIKHKNTGTWLHLDKDLRYLPTESESEEVIDPLDCLDEKKELFQVIATKEINSDDAFSLEKVEDNYVADFNYIAAVTATLADQIPHCEKQDGTTHPPDDCHMASALSSLKYLYYLMDKKRDQQIFKSSLKFLRCLKTLVLVVRLLDYHRTEDSNDPEVCTACFAIIINFLEGKSTKNKSYVSQMMRHIFTRSVKDTELIGGLTVEKALVGIAKDNPDVLYESALMKRMIEYVMEKLKATDKSSDKMVQLLEILSALCACKGVPVLQNQIIILEQLQSFYKESGDEENKMLYPLRVKPTCTSESADNGEDIIICIAVEDTDGPLITEAPVKLKGTGSGADSKSDSSIIQFEALESAFRKQQTGIWYELNRGSKQFHKLLVAQIHLLMMMCKGNNTKVIDVLRQQPDTKTFGVHIDLTLIMSAIKDNKIKSSYPKLRTALVELLKVMYVEVGENRPFLEKIPFSFKIDEVKAIPFESTTKGIDPSKAAITALTGVENSAFPTIREWISNFLQDEAEYFLTAEEDDKNAVVVKVLQTLTVLVKYGYYDDTSHVNEFLPAILKLLNGSKDFPTKQIKLAYELSFKGLMKRTHSSLKRGFTRRSIRRSRRDSIKEFEESLDQELSYEDMREILKKFQDGGRYEYSEEKRHHFEIKYWAMEVLNLLFNFQLYKSLHSFIHDFRWLSQPDDVLHTRRGKRPTKSSDLELSAVEEPAKLPPQELGNLISINPRDPSFFKESPELAKKVIASAKKRLMHITVRTDESNLNCNEKLPNVLLDLANYKYGDLVQRSLLLLDRYYTSQTDIFKKALHTQLLKTAESITLYNTIEGLFLKLFLFLRSGSVEHVPGPSPVKELTKYCWLEDEVEGFEPHQINQSIILSFGIFPDVLSFVVQYCNDSFFMEEEQKQKLIDCLAFLRALACKNGSIQIKLLRHVDSFIKAASGELGPYIGELLREIFTGGPPITLSVKEDQIWKLMCLIFTKGKELNSPTNTSLLSALNELLLVTELDLSLRYNQLLVVRYISVIREDERYWCRDLLAEGMGWRRWEILTSKDDSNLQLMNLLMITDLLASCAHGETAGVDTVCCTIYTEEELISIISSDDICIYRKRPFMKLLVGVYMNVHGDKAEERSYNYRKDRTLWDHMTKMAAVLSQVSMAMSSISTPAYLSVKELLASPMWKYSHKCPEQKHPKSPPTVVLVGEDNYQEHFNISDVLLYVSEGFLPFLQMFYSEFYRQDNLEQSLVEGETTNLLYEAMLAFHKPLNCERVYFSQEVQVKLYYRVLYLLKPHSTADLTEELSRTERSLRTRDVFSTEVMSLARKKYHVQYEEEVELNTTFNSFVANYKAAYEGRNVRREQIIDSSRKSNRPCDMEPYSDFLDEDQVKPGPKYLPLGRSFQEHISLFNRNSYECKKENNPKSKLLQQLQISLSKVESSHMTTDFDAERQTELDIKCLQILRASIYNKILLIDEEDKDRNPEKYRKLCEHHLHPKQNEIQDLGNAVAQVMPLLSHPDERIVYEVLAFLEAILEYGNSHVQEGLKEVIGSRQQVFPTLNAIVKKASIVYEERQLLITIIKARNVSDQKIAFKVEMMSSGDEGGDEPDFSVVNLRPRSSTIKSDGTLVLTDPRKGSSFRNFFRKREETKVILAVGNRVPFMALYQHAGADDVGAKANSILPFYDLSRISLISKVLGLMCEGQFKSMQNFLREQSEDINSINMVGEIASFLYSYATKHVVSEKTLVVLTQLLRALDEFCIGNYKNREVVFNENIVSVINFILQIDITKIEKKGSNVVTSLSIDDTEIGGGKDTKIDYVKLRGLALSLKASAVQLLDALLEEISNRTSRLSHQIAEGLDINALHWSMLDFFVLKSDPDMVQLKAEDDAYRALFDSYKIIMHLVDTGVAPLQSLKPTEKSILKAWDFCAEKSRSVEVVYKDEDVEEETLLRVHFNVNIESDISKQLRDTVKFGVDRTTQADKLRDFHKWMEAVKKDTIHRDWLRRKHLNLVEMFSRWRYWLFLLVTLILNILFIIFYNPVEFNPVTQRDEPVEVLCPVIYSFENSSLNDDLHENYVVSTFVLGSLYLLLAIWMVVEYFVLMWPHFVLPKFLYSYWAKLGDYNLTEPISKVNILPNFQWTYISVNIFGARTLFLIILLGIAFSPLYCFGYLYCISFLYIVVNNDILQRTLQAITKNWKSLFWVAVLLLIITYIYAVISFAFLRNEFVSEDNSDMFCDTVDQCFISVLRFGLLDSFLEVGVSDANDARLRFFFDITFFIIVTTIGLNIVFGIIVDSFSELRDAKFSAQQDMKSTCFICGLPSHEFERLSNNGFQRHVKKDHNMWAYIYYSIYLDEIDPTNHNAIEKYVYDKMRSGQIDYIPFQQALVLEGQEEDLELKEELERMQKFIGDRFNSIIHRFDALESLVQEKKTEQ